MSVSVLRGWQLERIDSFLLEEDHVRRLRAKNKLMAEQLLPRIPLPAVRAVTTTFQLNADFVVCSMVTLVHLAAYWGWRNVVTA